MRPSLRIAPLRSWVCPSTRTFQEDPAERGALDDPVLGPVVHRPTGPWTPAVHELLAFVSAAGLDGVPTVHGFDADGREVLSFLDGEALDPGVREPTDEMIPDAAAWLRRFHDVVRGVEPGPRAWRQTTADLAPGEIDLPQRSRNLQLGHPRRPVRGRHRLGSGGTGASDRRPRVPLLDGVPLFRDRAPAADVARRVRVAAGGVRRRRAERGPRRRRPAADAIASTASRRASSAATPGCCRCRRRGEPENTRRAVEAMLARMPGIRAAL